MKTTLLFLSVFLSVSLFGQNVYIPDANFKFHLVQDYWINTNGDSEIQVSEASAFTGAIYCEYENIADLTGIEAFTALTYLRCHNNQLTSLDVSQNTALIDLYCDNNQIASLDVSNNTALTILRCHNNQLTSLDVSNNTALTYLSCYSNQITSLDVSNNTALTYLNPYNNQLTSLDVSNNTALTFLYCANNQLECLNVKNGNNTVFVIFNASNNPNLTCIEVDDVNYSTTNWNNIDLQTSYSSDCNNACSCIPTSSTDIVSACDSYTWIDGNTYTASNNTATYTTTNAAGCDSVTLDLTINYSNIGTDVITACDSYTWIDGNTYTASNNTATFLTTNIAGCDSLITLDLTINTPLIGTDVQEICSGDEYTWIDGNIYTEPNDSVTYTMVGNNGCDSVVTLNLSVISVPEPIIIQNGNMLSCDNFATAYQWLDCDDNYAPIEGATDMVFTATQNGSYALEITFDACSDTSDCYDIDDFVGISELNSTPKQIVKIIDLMGRETSFKPNTPLIYVYDDGSIEKVFSVEY